MEETKTKLEALHKEGKLSPEAFKNITVWLENDNLKEFHAEIEKLVQRADTTALEDAFYTNIEFGTAGIRGKTGLGSARINHWTVGSAAQGLANYINSIGTEAAVRGVIIGRDTRITGPAFTDLVTNILASNGIQVYSFERPPQVGMFSYAVRLYKAQAGVYISASHNPSTDNGLKIYWEDGAQVLPPHDKAIIQAVKEVKTIKKAAPNQELMREIGEDFDTVYRTRVLHESVATNRSAKIVYSPFHGTGQYGVLPVLEEAGFEVITVPEQMSPDGNFPNVPGGVPNPQNRESNQLTVKKVLETKADLGISTDPDADRLGLVVPKGDSAVILDGNETATVLAYFIARRLKGEDKLPANGFMVRTVVTTPMMDAITEDFGLKIYNDLPVGFKYIGDYIKTHEDFGDELFLFGAEESYGSLKGSYSRDKDASSAALIAAELASWLKDHSMTFWDLFDQLYKQYGYYLNDLVDITYEGAEGFAKMTKLMEGLRAKPPKKIGNWQVVSMIDRQTNEVKDASGNNIGKVQSLTTNMLIYYLSEDKKAAVTVRPSGTEPKIKLYIALYNEKAKGTNDLESVIRETKEQAENLKEALKALVT